MIENITHFSLPKNTSTHHDMLIRNEELFKRKPTEKDLAELISNRIAIMDGAMGTMIQQEKLEEADFRGDHFKNHPNELKGNNDLLCLTRPDIIKKSINHTLMQVVILWKQILSVPQQYQWQIIIWKMWYRTLI